VRIDALLHSRAREAPERELFDYLGSDLSTRSSWTTGKLSARVKEIAGWLQELIMPGMRVILLLPTGPDFIASFLGCLEANVIPVPVPTVEANVNHLEQVVGDSDAIAIITRSDHIAVARYDFRGEDLVAWLMIDQMEIHGVIRKSVIRDTENIAYLQYTSGSTARPRGVVISHENVLSNLAAIDVDFRHTVDSIAVTWLPHYHDMGLVYGLLQPIFRGYKSYVLAPKDFVGDPLLWLQTISRVGATHSSAPNFAYDYCCDRIDAEAACSLQLEAWRVAVNGAEMVRHATMARFARKFAPSGFRAEAFYSAYGLAEATLKVSGGFVDHLNDQAEALTPKFVSNGAPAMATVVRIVDPVNRCRVADGEIGEIWVSGPGVASGYWSKQTNGESFGAEISASDSVAHGRKFLRTGDKGYIVDGQLTVVGRLKNTIVIRGRNFHAEEIEWALTSAPLSSRCQHIVFGSSLRGEEELVVVRGDRTRDKAELDLKAKEIRSHILRYFGVDLGVVCFVRKLPRTSSGKPQRNICKSWFEEDANRRFYHVWRPIKRETHIGRVQNVTRATLEQILVGLLGYRPLGPDRHTKLVELGLDSIRATQLASRLTELCRQEVPAWRLLEMSFTELVNIDRSSIEFQANERDHCSKGDANPAPLVIRATEDQARFWLLQKLAGNSDAYILALAVHVSCGIAPPRLLEAVKFSVIRHPYLRSGLDKMPAYIRLQRPDDIEIPIAQTTVTNLDVNAGMDSFRTALFSPFNLKNELAFRVVAIHGDNGSGSTIGIAVHHIIGDFESCRIIMRELLHACLLGEPPVEIDRSVAYLNDDGLRGDQGLIGARLRFWKDSFSDISPPSENFGPTELCKPVVQVWEDIDGDLKIAIEALAREYACTPFVILLAVFEAVIAEHSGARTFLVLVPYVNREQGALMNAVGLFARTVPIKATYDVQRSDKEHIHDVWSQLKLALEHSGVAFEQLMELLPMSRSRRMAALQFAMCNMITLDDGLWPELQGTIVPIEMSPKTSEFNYALQIVAKSTGFRLELKCGFYGADISSAKTLMKNYVTRLESAARTVSSTLVKDGAERWRMDGEQ